MNVETSLCVSLEATQVFWKFLCILCHFERNLSMHLKQERKSVFSRLTNVNRINKINGISMGITWNNVLRNAKCNSILKAINNVIQMSSQAAFRPTCISNLAFAHKGFIFNSFSIVFSVMIFQGIVFLESLLKRRFPQVQLWQIKQWKACYLSKTAVIKTETFCRRVRLRQMLQILQRIEKSE